VYLHIFGFGYVATALSLLLRPESFTTRGGSPKNTAQALDHATHLLITAPPELVPFEDILAEHTRLEDGEDAKSGDPCLDQFAHLIANSAKLQWIGYCSTTGVYGDRQGATVDEASAPTPTQPRSIRRLQVEQAWRNIRPDLPLDIFRLAGIYGPGRSAFDDLRAGRARRIIAPDHKFSRIHRDDAARAIAAAIMRPAKTGARILHLADDLPAASADVTAYAAELAGLPNPPAVPLAEALPRMSPMARSFWAESRLVENKATKRALGIRWLYPTYREGLEAIWAEKTQ